MKSHPYTYDFAMILCPRWGVGVPWTACAHLLEAVRVYGYSAQFLDYNVELYHRNGVPELWEDNLYHQYWKTQPLDACDVIVKGEGELTLLDILQNGVNKNLGTYTPGNGHWEFNGDRDLIDNLDSFSWPRYDDVDWSLFASRTASVMGSRGCINHCAFCNDIVRAEHRYRKRSALHIAEEMLYHKARHGVEFVIFNAPS